MVANKENALDLLNRLRDAITDGKIPDALKHLDALRVSLKDWQRLTGVSGAKDWIDAALMEDLLVFNTEVARQHLKNWQDAVEIDNDPELNRYRGLVEERIR